MKPVLTFILLFISVFASMAQMMSSEFNYLKKYMGINIIGGYTHQTLKHESLGRFANSFNTVFAPELETQLIVPKQYNSFLLGTEITSGILRLGYAHRINDPLLFESRYKNGSIRKMELHTPKHNLNFEILMPIKKGRIFLGMTTGVDYGYFILKSYLHNNFGRNTYANDDGLSGIFKSNINVQGRVGARLDIQFTNRLGVTLRAETYNTLISAKETPMVAWQDDFYVDAKLENVKNVRKYLAEDVTRRKDDYITLGNVLWESSPAVYGMPKGLVYTVSSNFLLFPFYKNQ